MGSFLESMNGITLRRSPKSLPSNVEVVPVDLAKLDAAWKAISMPFVADPEAEGWLTPDQYAKRFEISAPRARNLLSQLNGKGKLSKMVARHKGRQRTFYRPILEAQ